MVERDVREIAKEAPWPRSCPPCGQRQHSPARTRAIMLSAMIMCASVAVIEVDVGTELLCKAVGGFGKCMEGEMCEFHATGMVRERDSEEAEVFCKAMNAAGAFHNCEELLDKASSTCSNFTKWGVDDSVVSMSRKFCEKHGRECTGWVETTAEEEEAERVKAELAAAVEAESEKDEEEMAAEEAAAEKHEEEEAHAALGGSLEAAGTEAAGGETKEGASLQSEAEFKGRKAEKKLEKKEAKAAKKAEKKEKKKKKKEAEAEEIMEDAEKHESPAEKQEAKEEAKAIASEEKAEAVAVEKNAEQNPALGGASDDTESIDETCGLFSDLGKEVCNGKTGCSWDGSSCRRNAKQPGESPSHATPTMATASGDTFTASGSASLTDCSRYTIEVGCEMMTSNGCSWSGGKCIGGSKTVTISDTAVIPGVGGNTPVAVAVEGNGGAVKMSCSMYDATGESVCVAMKDKGCSWSGGKCVGSITETDLNKLLSIDGEVVAEASQKIALNISVPIVAMLAMLGVFTLFGVLAWKRHGKKLHGGEEASMTSLPVIVAL